MQHKLAVGATPTWPAPPVPRPHVRAVGTRGHLDYLPSPFALLLDCPALEGGEVFSDGSVHKCPLVLVKGSLRMTKKGDKVVQLELISELVGREMSGILSFQSLYSTEDCAPV